MNKTYKTISLFFAATLFALSIITQEYCLLLTTYTQHDRIENSHSYFSTEKPDFIFLIRQEERVVFSVKNLTGPDLKIFPNYICYNSLSLEERIISLNSEYLCYSEVVNISLPGSDIVFPFHYFW